MLLGFSRARRTGGRSSWWELERVCDSIVDDVWAEPVELYPWKLGGVEDNPTPDPTRAVLKTRGVFMLPDETGIGAGGGMTSPLTGVTWVSLSIDSFKASELDDWVEGDRVFFPDRQEWYVVDHQSPSATGRPNIYLARLEDTSL
jgi:hypothetical protein